MPSRWLSARLHVRSARRLSAGLPWVALPVWLVLLLGCARSQPAVLVESAGPVWFEDITDASGLHFVHDAGPTDGSYFMPQVIGSGAALFDFDGDGWPDIFVANDAKPNHLWINQHDGTFREEGALRGVSRNATGHAEGNMGIAIGDLSGNGQFDLFVTHLTEETHTLWVQRPRGFFP